MEILDNNSKKQYKAHLLHLFEKFISFCEEHSLNYFCTGGTMLGAVRHHGLIPWDDDIDLFMMRKDYEALIALQSELKKINIGLEGIQCNDRFSVFLKIWDMETTLWEIEEIPYVYGVFIDIFPLDYSDDTPAEFLAKYKKRRRLYLLYQLSQMHFSMTSFINRMSQRDYKFVAKEMMSLFIPKCLRGSIRHWILKEDKSNQNTNGKYLASYYGDYWEREYLKSEWFDDFEIVDFEYLKVKIPSGYDGYLSQIYHDYLKLPPKEKQISHHYHYFLDLNHHYNIGQVKSIIKKK